MKYPYVTIEDGSPILIYKECTGIFMDEADDLSPNLTAVFASEPENYTVAHLANTYGKVESPEHAGFIIELCEANGIEIWGGKYADSGLITTFAVIKGEMQLHAHNCVDVIKDFDLKQITIPMPPKKQDWPQVGDEVDTETGLSAVKLLPDTQGYYVVETIQGEDAGLYMQYQIDDLSKPKTEDEILRDKLIELTLNHMENKSHPIEANAYYLVSEIIEKYIKKPQ